MSKTMIRQFHPAAGPALVFLASLAVLLAAYGFQFIGGLEPCELCYWQRYPYYVIIPLSALATILAVEAPASRFIWLLMALCFLAFLGGASIAAYHAGIEYGWWPGPQSCTAQGILGETAEAFLEAIKNRNIVMCDEVAWSLFGISMAGYNFLISLALGLLSLNIAYIKAGHDEPKDSN